MSHTFLGLAVISRTVQKLARTKETRAVIFKTFEIYFLPFGVEAASGKEGGDKVRQIHGGFLVAERIPSSIKRVPG